MVALTVEPERFNTSGGEAAQFGTAADKGGESLVLAFLCVGGPGSTPPSVSIFLISATTGVCVGRTLERAAIIRQILT
jgi:hypothetical protein